MGTFSFFPETLRFLVLLGYFKLSFSVMPSQILHPTVNFIQKTLFPILLVWVLNHRCNSLLKKSLLNNYYLPVIVLWHKGKWWTRQTSLSSFSVPHSHLSQWDYTMWYQSRSPLGSLISPYRVQFSTQWPARLEPGTAAGQCCRWSCH